MTFPEKPTAPQSAPQWLHVAAAFTIVILMLAALVSSSVLIGVFTSALTAVLAYIAVCFACHSIAALCGAVNGLGTVFNSWR